jgi:hypothetical protein
MKTCMCNRQPTRTSLFIFLLSECRQTQSRFKPSVCWAFQCVIIANQIHRILNPPLNTLRLFALLTLFNNIYIKLGADL